MAAQEAASASRLEWQWLGPGNIGGRVRSIVVHPTNPYIMFAGSVSGGIWKTTDGGASWLPVDDFMANLAVACMVFDPTNPNVMYAGTGEGFFNFDAILGAGIFKSADGGTTWTQLPSTTSYQFQKVNRLAFSSDARVLLAATQSGVFRSVDRGATFTLVLDAPQVLDVAVHPTDNTKALASGIEGRAWYSRDGGSTWTPAGGLTFKPGLYARVEIAYARSQPDIVYASEDSNGGELYRSIDGGATYVRAGSISGYLANQGWYDHALWVNPKDSNDLVLGGVYLYRTRDAGVSMTSIWNNSVHVDFHAVVEHPGFDNSRNTTVFVTNDGGVYKLESLPASATDAAWQSLNHNLGVTQFYGAAGSPTTGVILGGTQDNRTLFYSPTNGIQAWTRSLTSDGGFVAIDPVDPRSMYAEMPYLQIYRFNQNGSTSIYSGITEAGTGSANFIAPFVLDPNQPARMLAGGASLWRSDDVRDTFAPRWTAIKPPITSNNISAIAVAPGNSDIIWVGYTFDGAVFKTTNGTSASPTWTRADIGLPKRMVTRISIDPLNSNVVYATYGAYTPDNIYKTINGGATWTDSTGTGTTGLPAAPVRDVEIDPMHPQSIWAATEVGIFHSADGGATWDLPQDGPANVSVDELSWMGTRLLAATYGRGVYALDLGVTPAGPAVKVRPNPVQFPEQTVGTSSDYQLVYVTNSGSASLSIGAVRIAGANAADFRISGDLCSGASVPPAASCNLWVNFMPAARGSRTATLSIASNATSSPDLVALGGTGLAPAGGPLPTPWQTSDIGNVGIRGSAFYSNSTFTLKGSGADIWGSADAFRFVYQTLSGDGSIVARVATVQNVYAWTKAGVMIRQTLDAGSAHASLFVTPGKGIALQSRTIAGGTSTSTATTGTAPRWVKVARAGNVLSAAQSTDGASWSTIGQVTIAMPAAVFIGLAVASHDNSQLASATVDNVAVTTTSSSALPPGWNTGDIGSVGSGGGAAESSGTWTVRGSGADIWAAADAFRFAYRQLPGDGTIVARVATVQNVNAWTKAGVMIRQTLDPGSAHGAMFVTPGKGIAFQRRTAADGTSTTTGVPGTAPRWVKLVRAGQTVTASVSPDGSVWTTVGRDTIALSGAVWVGLATTSHDNTKLCTATFDHVGP